MREAPSLTLYAPLVALLQSSQHIVLISHRSPDGDTVGSALAVAMALRSLHKQVTLVCVDPIPSGLYFLAGWEQYVSTIDQAATADLILAIDCADSLQLGQIAPAIMALTQPEMHSDGRQEDALPPAPVLANLDHHRSNTNYAAVNVVDPESASVAEMVYWLLQMLQVPLTASSAQALLTGIINDTHSFQNANATPQALWIASELVTAGADAGVISYHLFRARRPESAQLWSKVLATLVLSDAGHVASAITTTQMFQDCGADSGSDTDGIVDFLSSIIGVDLAILVKQTAPDSSKASLRTTEQVDAVALAKVFGGGGHSRAAGCDVPGEPSAALAALLSAYRELSTMGGSPAA